MTRSLLQPDQGLLNHAVEFFDEAFLPAGGIVIPVAVQSAIIPDAAPHSTPASSASGFPANVDLHSLDGTTGFIVTGPEMYSVAGFSVASAGDVNGDGFADVIIGAPYVTGPGDPGTGYILFGHGGAFDANFALSSVDGANGIALKGTQTQSYTGFSVASAGDLNGDGFADVIIGAPLAGSQGAGTSYVVFGHGGAFDSSLTLSSLNGTNGFSLSGPGHFNVGRTVASAGDINGDGFADLLVGTSVIFGHGGSFGSQVDLSKLNGTNGFNIKDSQYLGDATYLRVASAGDVNGDGYADFIVSTPRANVPQGGSGGESFVVFGHGGTFRANLDVASLNGSNGFALVGDASPEKSGFSVASAGDINGDGYSDVILGAPDAAVHGTNAGAAYVVFGHSGTFAASIELSQLDGTNGFEIDGLAANNEVGWSVASAGDVNGDGFTDIVIGAPGVTADGVVREGASYVIFGHAGGFSAKIDLATLDGTNGFKLSGGAYDLAGRSVASAGDINGDGFGDLIVGAPYSGAPYSRDFHAGMSFVVFGRAPTTAVTRIGSAIGQTISGGAFNDQLSGLGGDDILHGNGGKDHLSGGDGNDTLDGGTGADTMSGGLGDDTYIVDNAGDVVTEAANAGTDTVRTTLGTYQLTANVENLIYTGTSAFHGTGNTLANTIQGGAGKDMLDGGAGADTMIGGAGDDIYIVDSVFDVVTEAANAGTDTVKTTLLNYVLGANVENLIFTGNGPFKGTGNALDNAITGGAGGNTLSGLGGNDTLIGGSGKDVFIGGNGQDHITSNGGNDIFRYAAVTESTSGTYDVLTGVNFNGSAHFDLPVAVSAIDKAAKGALSQASFDTDLAHVLKAAQLGAGHAVLVKASAGSLEGDTFLVVDANGHAGYQAGKDFVFELVDATHLDSLAATAFL